MWKRLCRMRLINKCIGFIFAVMTASSANAVSDTLFPSVFVKPLPAVSINTVGIETGIPVDIWGVSSRSDMERLIKELLGYSLSPAMQNVLADLNRLYSTKSRERIEKALAEGRLTQAEPEMHTATTTATIN